MSQKQQPYNGFRWMSRTELLLELKTSPKEFFERKEGGKMCGVMIDFTVPRNIHNNNKTWDYPLMPEKASIPEECLSPKQVELNVNNNNCTKHSTRQEYSSRPCGTSTSLFCVW